MRLTDRSSELIPETGRRMHIDRNHQLFVTRFYGPVRCVAGIKRFNWARELQTVYSRRSPSSRCASPMARCGVYRAFSARPIVNAYRPTYCVVMNATDSSRSVVEAHKLLSSTPYSNGVRFWRGSDVYKTTNFSIIFCLAVNFNTANVRNFSFFVSKLMSWLMTVKILPLFWFYQYRLGTKLVE